jgi:hypothetical protein
MPEMKVLDLADWPFAARMLLQYAQEVADDRLQATVSGAHLARAVLDIQPARQMLGDAAELGQLDAAVERALLLTPKGFGKSAGFEAHLGRVLTSGALGTADLLRTATLGVAGLDRVHGAVAEHAEAIAALLDAPQVSALLSAPSSEEARKACPFLLLAFAEAAKRKQRRVTTRHVVAVAVRVLEKARTEQGLPGFGDTAPRLDLLLEREPKRPEGAAVSVSTPRLFGAVAAAVAQKELPLALAVVQASLVGDEGVAFAKDVVDGLIRRFLERESASPPGPTPEDTP